MEDKQVEKKAHNQDYEPNKHVVRQHWIGLDLFNELDWIGFV